ncbi:hypothetical protein LXL04_001225 [Taraxacum kok-saghyz]
MVSSSSSSKSATTKSRSTKKIFDDANCCWCGLPSRIWTSKTENNPDKRFRACPNRWKPTQENCSFWQWVDEGKGFGTNEEKFSILENELTVFKLKTNQELNKMSRKLWMQNFFIFMFFLMFLVKIM